MASLARTPGRLSLGASLLFAHEQHRLAAAPSSFQPVLVGQEFWSTRGERH